MKHIICQNEQRRELVRQHQKLNGLDYLEVESDQRTLSVFFLGKAPVELGETQVLIEGGRRITDIRVEQLEVHHFESAELDDYMQVIVDQVGDFSTYTLRVVERCKDKEKEGQWQPHSAFDPRYDRVDFNFKADCPSDLDCKQKIVCPPEPTKDPEINYLAKDYASFRQLILDRLALVMPEWKERHVPDIGIALVEVLAYVGDHLSYYQDAVATEAYLATARKRISVRRHARLVDYNMHEGGNARAWLCVHTNENLSLDPKEIYFITSSNESMRTVGGVLHESDLDQNPSSVYEVFEPMRQQAIQLYRDHSKIAFYTWGDKECCLPQGTTSATLVGELVQDTQSEEPACEPDDEPESDIKQIDDFKSPQAAAPDNPPPKLHLKPGDVLIFEEVLGPETGHPGDADPKHRHAVRLTRVEAGVDKLNGDAPVVEICWAEEDALPFPLCLSVLGPPPECECLDEVSIACGNIILVDHGKTQEEGLGRVPEKESVECCKAEGILADRTVFPGYYRPSLKYAPLTFSEPPAAEVPASKALIQDVRQALPSIKLTSILGAPEHGVALLSADEIKKPEVLAKRLKTDSSSNSQPLRRRLSEKVLDVLEKHNLSTPLPSVLKDALITLIENLTLDWQPRGGLLASGPDDQHFVAEMDNEGRAHLRFGDDKSGEQPDAGIRFHSQYRIGNGLAGNVGAETILHLVLRNGQLSGVSVRNPMPAQGGIAPEPVSEVKLFAPRAFRKELQRAITADDYAAIVQREFKAKVQRAAAKLRWTGSWYEVLVAVDPYGQEEAGSELLEAISKRLHRYRRIGHDLVVKSARRVPLDIEILVCVLPNYLRGHVKATLLDLFSNRRLPNGRLGFFHPDNLSFGEGVFLSPLVALAQAVEGVESVQVNRLKRQNQPPNDEIENGILSLGAFEIARLDNDPNFPENGILKLDMRGGR